jgi:single-strand DNA-binding protein
MLNMVIVIGKLTRPLQVRSLPSGVWLASFDLHVVRADESVDTVLVALFQTAENAVEWKTGEELLVVGRVRRRFFRIGGSTQSRTEVVAEIALSLNHKDKVCTALADAGTALAGIVDDLNAG